MRSITLPSLSWWLTLAWQAIEVKEDAADPKSLILGDTRLHKTTPISLANKSFDLGQLWCFLLHKQVNTLRVPRS